MLNVTVNPGGFALKRLRHDSGTPREEVFRLRSTGNRRGSSRPVTNAQAFAGRDNWQVAGHNSSIAEHFPCCGPRIEAASAEIIDSDGGYTTAHSVVEGGESQVGILRSRTQRRNSAVAAVVDVDVRHVHNVEARPIATVPGIEAVTGADGKPTHRAKPAAE